MKALLLLIVGGVIGIFFAKLSREKTAAPIVDASSARVVATPVPRQRSHSLRAVLTPIYEVLLETPGKDFDAVSVAMRDARELDSLLAAAPPDEAADSARRVAEFFKAAARETERGRQSTAQLGERNSTDFFAGVYEKRWEHNMAVLSQKAAPEWRRFLAADSPANYPQDFQAGIKKFLDEKAKRALAELVHFRVDQVLNDGVIARKYKGYVIADDLTRNGGGGNAAAGEYVGKTRIFIRGLPNAAAGQSLRAHLYREGAIQFGDDRMEQWAFVD